jgi:hypothetical protein
MALRLINLTGSVSKVGYLCKIAPNNKNAFVYTSNDETNILGVIAESVPNRSECEVITSGEALIFIAANVNKGDVIRSRKSGDTFSSGASTVVKSGDAPYLQVGLARQSGKGLVLCHLINRYVTSSSGVDTTDTFTALNEPTGFENRTDSAWTFTNGTQTLSVTTALSYNIWFKGVKHTISSTKDIVIADTEGTHLIYFDTDDVLHDAVNPTDTTIDDLIRNKCLVAYVYWDATNNVGVYTGEERHGTIMDGSTHSNLHFTRGLQFISGLGLGDFVIGNGSLDSHAQFSIGMGVVADEDIALMVSAINSTTGVSILYREGANGYWRTVTQAGFSCYKNPAGVTNRLMYNRLNLGTWSASEVGEGNYVLYHIFATTGKLKQMYSIMGQAEYTTLPLAKAGATIEVSALLLGSLPSPEIRPVATVLFQTDKDYANTINARVIEPETGVKYIDWRTNDLPRGTAPSDHGSLSGLTDDDHPQYLKDEFETVSKNLRNYPYVLTYGVDGVATITYDLGGGLSVVKTFNYTLGVLTTIVLSGSTPTGIELTKTFSYTGADLTSVAYS